MRYFILDLDANMTHERHKHLSVQALLTLYVFEYVMWGLVKEMAEHAAVKDKNQ